MTNAMPQVTHDAPSFILTPSDICSFLVLCQVQALVDLWTSNGKSVVEKLKQRSLAPKQVTSRGPVPVRQI